MIHGGMRQKTGEEDFCIFNMYIFNVTGYHCSAHVHITVVTFSIRGKGKHPGRRDVGQRHSPEGELTDRLKSNWLFSIVLVCKVFTSVMRV